MRKTIAVILSAVMLLSVLCVGSFAAETQNVASAADFLAMTIDGSYKLTADIELTQSYDGLFRGTLDGDGHTVTVKGVPMFKEFGGFAKNFTIVGDDIVAEERAGALAAFAPYEAYVENVTNKVNVTVTGLSLSAGGIIGEGEGYTRFTFVNCTNEGNVTVNSTPDLTATEIADKECWAGGMIGRGDIVVCQYCTNKGAVKTTSTYPIGALGISGGMVGRTAWNACYNYVDIEFCVNEGEIYGSKDAGGFLGYSGVKSNSTQPEYDSMPYTMKANVNYGTITGHRYAGGIAGYCYCNGTDNKQIFNVLYNINFGDIKGGACNSATGAAAAGWASDIVSYSNSTKNVLCYNIGAGTVSYHGEPDTTAPNATFLGCSSAQYEDNETFFGNYVCDGGYYQYTTYASSGDNADRRHDFAWGVANGYVTRVEASQLQSGEIAFKINSAAEINAFYQTIGVDAAPLPFNSSKFVVSDGNGGYINADRGTFEPYAPTAIVTEAPYVATTAAPKTDAPTAAPTEPKDDPTEAPTQAQDQPTEPAATNAPETQPAEKKGCGSVVACGVAVIAILGCAYVAKKEF